MLASMKGYCHECNMPGGPSALTFIHLCDSFASGTRVRRKEQPWFSTGAAGGGLNAATPTRIETIIFDCFRQAAEKPQEISIFRHKFTLHLHAAVASICQT
ncbi:hypothetical protein [Agrobacterium tumefaciens]|uniref:hypothetical protein n=1 Tax=Agrobacterium tumefaciens TaxID=358 RepID=UPI0015746598|nr:hypothetical protein [Agrobacterium tumefaciens]WCJ61646.1 hypothetical protein G6M15_09345 [Agrobacterium tumefaciens]